MTVSKSPDRLTFQKEAYVERCEKEGKLPNPDYLKMYEEDMKRYDARFETEESKQYSMEYDLLTTPWILEKVRHNNAYAQNLYASMCNNEFIRLDVIPILTEQTWSCSWRYAGGIISDMRQEGDYIDWYCSGMGGLNQEYDSKETNEQWQARTGYVPEGRITDEIRVDLKELGWVTAKGGDWEHFE